MNKILYNLLIFCIFFIAVDVYFWQAFKNNFLFSVKDIPILKWIYWLCSIAVLSLLIYSMSNYQNTDAPKYLIVVRAFVISFYLAKILACFPLLLDDLLRIFKWFFSWFKTSVLEEESAHKISRSNFLKNLSFIIGSLFFGLMSWGIVIGRFNYKKHRINLALNKWPKALNGLKIIQISDLHLGSFTSTKPVEDIVELINQEQADIVLFTGDLVNNNYWEADEFIPHLAKIKSKYGKYSIMGNHDYGDYLGIDKRSEEGLKEWNENLTNFHKVHQKIGFDLLLNENRKVEINGSSFNLIGVENWGAGGFSKYGDFQKSIAGLDSKSTSILLSHDPSHWDAEVRKHSFPIELQLSGHTHGMQFGIELGSFKWSPVKYRYPQWAGIHSKDSKKLYVNRGIGHLGYAGRVGIYPEITIFEILSLEA
jgi:predicted MPP superfamily phosphohydrolase